MAYGPLLEREGDLYGPVVNLASRITAIAFPGSIVVGPAFREQLADHEAYRLRSMRPAIAQGHRPGAAVGAPAVALRPRADSPSGGRALRDAVRARVEPG